MKKVGVRQVGVRQVGVRQVGVRQVGVRQVGVRQVGCLECTEENLRRRDFLASRLPELVGYQLEPVPGIGAGDGCGGARQA